MLRAECRPLRTIRSRSFEPNRGARGLGPRTGVRPPVSEFPLADLYVCWHSEALYLGLMAQDVVEDVFYRDKVVRASDRAEWSVVVHGDPRQPIRARLGAGLEPVVDEPAARIINLSGINGNHPQHRLPGTAGQTVRPRASSSPATPSNSPRHSSRTAAATAPSGRERSG